MTLLKLTLQVVNVSRFMPSDTFARFFSATVFVSFLSSTGPAIAMTFEEVCALSTTVNCWGFESESNLYYTWPSGTSCDQDPFLQNHPNGKNGFGLDRQGSKGNTSARADNAAGECVYPKRDATHAASGQYSLKLRQPSQSSNGADGFFNPVFKRFGEPPNSTFARFGPGGEFWVRFAMRNSDEILSTVYWANGQGPGSNNGGIKRLIIHGYESSENLEETIVDSWHRRLPHMYSNSGTESYGVQDHIGCFEKDNNPASYPEPPCRKFKANVWRVYQVHVIVGSATDPSNCKSLGTCTGVVELYLDDEPDPIIRITNADHHTATGPAYSETALWDGISNGYGKLSFTFFATNKDPNQVHPEGIVWYDDVVVSHVRVPPITQSATVRPNPPSNLIVQ
jgi:hypothetical protein